MHSHHPRIVVNPILPHHGPHPHITPHCQPNLTTPWPSPAHHSSLSTRSSPTTAPTLTSPLIVNPTLPHHGPHPHITPHCQPNLTTPWPSPAHHSSLSTRSSPTTAPTLTSPLIVNPTLPHHGPHPHITPHCQPNLTTPWPSPAHHSSLSTRSSPTTAPTLTSSRVVNPTLSYHHDHGSHPHIIPHCQLNPSPSQSPLYPIHPFLATVLTSPFTNSTTNLSSQLSQYHYHGPHGFTQLLPYFNLPYFNLPYTYSRSPPLTQNPHPASVVYLSPHLSPHLIPHFTSSLTYYPALSHL